MISMGIYGISKLSILSGVLLILQIGAADRSSSSSSSSSSTTDLRHESEYGAPAIHTATHLFNQKTQQSLRGAENALSLEDDDTLQTLDNERLKQLQVKSSDIYHRKLSSVTTAATPIDSLTELSRYTTAETSTIREHITQSDIRANFGTTTSSDTLTKVDTNLRTTTSAESLTQGDPKYLSSTTSSPEILTESPSKSSSGLTTEQAEVLTVSSATQKSDDEELATEALLKSSTTTTIYSESITEGVAKTETSTVVPAAANYVTVADTTDSNSVQSIHRTSRPSESVTFEEEETLTTRDEGVKGYTTTPSPPVAFILPVGDLSLPEENKADDAKDNDDDNAIHVIERPIAVTDGPSAANNFGAMPDTPQITPSQSNDVSEEDDKVSEKLTTEANDDETTTSDDGVAVISMTTDAVSTLRTSTEPDMEVVTEKNSEVTTAETLEEKLSGFFRCADGTLIDIASLCDKKADCPDYSDEDACDAEEKANLTKQIHQPSINWNEMAPEGSRDDTLISLDDSSSVGVVEMERSRTEAPTTFRCVEGGNIIPISAVCDKRADCLDYSDEYDCDGKKHVTEATTTMETTTEPWTMNPKYEKSATIEVLNEDEEEVEFFRCLDGIGVIPMRAVCDKKWDCLDFSDEDECDSKGKLAIAKPNKTRPGLSWATPPTPAHLPDREQNMIIEELPDAKGTLPEHWRCENGNYIFITSVCDKKDDCGDFSDEDDCTGNRKIPTTEAPDIPAATTLSSFTNHSESVTLAMTTPMTTTVQSTPASLTLFQDDDVKSWSQGVTPAMDVIEEKFPVAMFDCDDGQQIEAMKVCDRNIDCFDGSDEDDCYDGWFGESNGKLRFARETGSGTGPTPVECGAGFFQCNDDTCIDETLTCNGISNCLEGEDEDLVTLCMDACGFPNLNDRVVLATGTPSQSLYLNGTVLVLDCTIGSTLTGDASITCISGSFTESPVCSRSCHIDLFRTALTCSSEMYVDGSNPNCNCDSGYNLEIANEAITCSDSLLIPSHPQCEETNECLLTVSPCDPLADCFNMPMGSFTCICNAGYFGNGTYCEDIDECTTSAALCDEDATCSNTAGSYTCECNMGFVGDGFSCVEQIYYDYGAAAGDTSIKDTPGSTTIDGYSVSGPLERRRLIPVGDQLFRYVHITNTGVIAFSNTLSEDLSEFSHPSAFVSNSSGMPVIAVFGIEARTSPSDSSVYYHVYEDTSTDDFTTELLANVSTQVNDALISSGGSTEFTPKWAMVITWVLLRRFGTVELTTETNTFQAVLTTDGSKTYVVQLYEESSMLWDDGQLSISEVPVIGNRLSNSFFDLQSSESYTRDQMYRPDSLVGNIVTGGTMRKRNAAAFKYGQFVFRIDENSDTFVNPAEYCQDWYDSTSSISSDVPGVLPCPCTRLQAMNDRRFKACTPYYPLNQFAFGASIEDYPSYLENSDQCLQQVFPSFQFSGSRCIYNRSESLVVGYDSMWESSHLQSVLADTSFFSFFYLSWIFNDVLPRHYCCSQSTDSYFCNLYEERRPPRTCRDYTPVGQGWGQGDPHITTLDKFEFTFNGLGEYLLIEIPSTGFELQGRTEKAFNSSGFEVDTGTVFTSFVASQGATMVQFDLNEDRTNLTILINGTIMIDPVELQTTEYNSTDTLFSIRYDSTGASTTGTRYIATWRESTNSSNDVSLNVGNGLRMLDFTFQAPQAYMDGSTRGLYGVWDNDITNDVTQPDGTVLADPMSLTEEQLFTYGELWRVPTGDSLFTYTSPETWNTFNLGSFQPMFLSALNETADPAFRAAVMADCGGDSACLFDALATNDLTIGANTMMIGMSRVQEVVELENYPPILSNVTEMNPDAEYPGVDGDGILTMIVGRSYMYQASATDRNVGDVIKYTLRGNIPSNATIDPVSGVFTWTPANIDPVSIGIEASDGTVSRYLQLTIIVCDCANNGTCDFTSIMEGNNINNDKFAVAQCECSLGWSGSFCTDDYNSCELNPCYPGVTCIDDPPPSVVARCSACPASLTGNGFQCWDLDECAEMTDGCDQLCVNSVGSFNCDCNAGYDLQPNLKDCIDINECDRATDECDENAMCINNEGSYSCECNEGYILQTDNRTCTDVDECTDSQPCDVNADCGNVIGSYSCLCRSGYQGNGRVCEDINECFNPDLNDCSELASCENEDGYFVCQCLNGYEGSGLNCTDRNECEEGVSQCSLDAECQNVPGSFMCSCDPGYTGDGNTCVDIDECADASSNNCDVNALCTNSLGSFSCECNVGYNGTGTACEDINECLSGSEVCASTATCTNTEGTFICNCNDGYSGDGTACTDINECEQQSDDCSQNCINNEGSYNCTCNPGFVLDADGATCNAAVGMDCTAAENPCTGGSVCMNAAGLITCTCIRGYTQATATDCQDINECDLNTDNCDMSVGVCSNTPGGYTCSCTAGYMLGADERTCSNINECETGDNTCSADATCDDLPGSYNCTCNAGFSGDGMTCANINECDGSPCVENSDCTDTVGSYMCSCSSGYVGDQILGCNDMDECLGMPCDVNGNCTNTPGSFSCSCLSGFTGNGMSCTDILECSDPNRCVANSDCMELEGSYTCVCITGYRGDGTKDCVDVDECLEDATICHSQATCTNTLGSYTCSCNPGYEGNGTSCTNVNECELGTIDCDVNSNCTDTEGSYTCYCLDGYFDATGGRAAAGECSDVDECALQVDACDTNSVCMNNNGSYTCVCNSGYMSVSQTMCTDILECSADRNPCNTGAFEICNELEGGYECLCQASTFRVDGVCTMATTLFLITEFVDIRGLVVEYYFDELNNDATMDELANDTLDVLMASPNFANILLVDIQSMTLLSGGIVARVVFRVDIPITSSATENDLALAFEAGLVGTRNNILQPDNIVYVETATNVDDNECKNSTICPTLSMCINSVGSYSCKCNQGYTFTDNNNDTCGDIDECAISFCSEYSNCTNSIGSFECDCFPGFTGDGVTCIDNDECAVVDICGSNTDCTNIPGSYNCSCSIGYAGTPPTCTDVDECALGTDACTQNCTNNDGSYDCSCITGYVLDADGFTCNDVNECTEGTDGCSQNCTNNVGSFTCSCLPGYLLAGDGVTCNDINECAENTDGCDQLCINNVGSFTCSCLAGYVLDMDGFTCNDVNECTEDTDGCSQNCTNNVGSFTCSCLPGYDLAGDGFTCNDIDECMTGNVCGNNAMCNNTVGSYVCSCDSGYTGAPPATPCQDIDECMTANDCGNNATCSNIIGSYVCTCDDGYTGTPPSVLCQDVNECTDQTDLCTQNCINNVGSYMCSCNPGFELDADGFTCNVAPEMECDAALDPCTGGGVCMNATGLITCTCSRGYSSFNDTHCQDDDECVNMTDNCDTLVGSCTNTPGGYNCSCSAGYFLAGDDRTCSDINECTAMTDDCDATFGICTNTVGGFNCSCSDGYMLDADQKTCIDINECANTNPCLLKNEVCVNSPGSYDCVCGEGFNRISGYCLVNATITGSITINLVNSRLAPYTDALADPTSAEYINLQNIVCGAFLSVVDGWLNDSSPYPTSTCKITGFTPGAFSETIVSYELTIYGESVDAVANSTNVVMTNGFSGTPITWTDADGNTVQLLSLFFDDAEECTLETSCAGINEGCTELDPGFECYCENNTVLFDNTCLYYTTLIGSFKYNRINNDIVTYTDALADPTSAAFTNMSQLTCGVFVDQIEIWVNASSPYMYIDCNITAFRPGSIIVDFIITIYGETQMVAMMRKQVATDNGFRNAQSNWTDGSYVIYVDELVYDNLCETTSPCQNGAICNYDVITNTTSCSCRPGFDGASCENKVACDGYTCENGGVCEVDIIGNPYCDCPAEYTGMLCETPVSCEELDCQNNSTCEVNSNGVAICNCLDGYEGNRCQLESTPGLSTGAIVGIVLGAVGFILLIVLLCFCCLILFAARRRRQRKRELLEGADNWGYGGRRYAPASSAPSAPSAPGPSRGAIVRNDPTEFASESSDNFYYYQNTRGRPFSGALGGPPSARPMFNVEEEDDDDTIDSRFSGIIRNMWNMHADQRPEAAFDPRQLPATSNFMAGGIPRASVQPRNLYPEYNNSGFERPYVADGTESNAYSEETEEFRPYRGRTGREKPRGNMDPYSYF